MSHSLQRNLGILFSIGGIIVLAWVGLTRLRAEPDLCVDLFYLIDQSESDFQAIREETSEGAPETARSPEIKTSYLLLDAQECSIQEDAVKASYHCTWHFPLSDAQADTKYEALVAEAQACIGNIAEVQIDQPVNHPDIYRASYFQIPQGQVGVSLKNKSQLNSTLVSFRIDGTP